MDALPRGPAELAGDRVVSQQTFFVLAATGKDDGHAAANDRRAGKTPAGRLEVFVGWLGLRISRDVARPNEIAAGGIETVENAAAAERIDSAAVEGGRGTRAGTGNGFFET